MTLRSVGVIMEISETNASQFTFAGARSREIRTDRDLV